MAMLLGILPQAYSLQMAKLPEEDVGIDPWVWDDIVRQAGGGWGGYNSFAPNSGDGGYGGTGYSHGGGSGRSGSYGHFTPPHREITFSPSTNSPALPSVSYFDRLRGNVVFWSNELGTLSIPTGANSDIITDDVLTVYLNGVVVYRGVPSPGATLTFTSTMPSIFTNEQLQWMSTHINESMDLVNELIDDEFALDTIEVTQTLIKARMAGINIGPGDDFFRFLSTLYPNLTSDLLYFPNLQLNVAITRKQHPDWTTARVYLDVLKDDIHNNLSLAGMFPIVGSGFNVVDGFLYSIEGDTLSAGLSYAAALPIGGWISTGAKWAFAGKAITAGTKMERRAGRLLWHFNEFTNEIDFPGDARQLRARMIQESNGALTSADKTWEAHHIIPNANEFRYDPVIQEAAKAYSGDPAKLPFHPNNTVNGIAVQAFEDVGGYSKDHPLYNQKVSAALRQIEQEIIALRNANRFANPNEEYNFARGEVEGLQNRIRQAINNAIESGPDPVHRFVDLDKVSF